MNEANHKFVVILKNDSSEGVISELKTFVNYINQCYLGGMKRYRSLLKIQ